MGIALAQLQDRARRLTGLHVKGDPLILFNVWDAGSAKAVRDAGAQAIATGSWSVAAAHGYGDGEQLLFDLVVANVQRIAASVDLAVTVDLESRYGRGGAQIEENVARVIAAGAVGINFEDQWIGEGVIYCVEEQSARIAAVRAAAVAASVPMFINARTDLFLESEPARHPEHMDDAIRRARAYADAGASGLFVPGLRDPALIARICEGSTMPVNVMFTPEGPTIERLATLV